MIRQVTPLVFASALGLLAVNCGSSTPDSNTPQRQIQTGGPDQAGRSDPASAGYPMSGPGASDPAGSERMPTAGRDETAGAHGAAMALSDAQIAAILELAHSSEIEQAQLAQSKSQNPQVLNLASMIIREHMQARQEQSAFGLSSAPSQMSQMLSQQSQQTLSTLRSASGRDFDRAYLKAQVEQHQKLIDDIDRKLMPNAENAQLRGQLQELRPVLQRHLETAREAQQLLGTSGSQSTGSGASPSGSSNPSGGGAAGGR